MSEIIDKNNEQIISFFKALDRLSKGVESLTENCKPLLNGEQYLTDKQLSTLLKIDQRTLQAYRTERKISYYKFGGKVLYKESDIEKMLEENYVKKFEKKQILKR